MKKIKLKTLIHKADKLFSEYIRKRDGKCLKCGKKENLQCAHIFSRSRKSVRWNPLNAVTLCGGCHLYWSHIHIMEFADWVKDGMTESAYYELKSKSRELLDNNTDIMEGIIEGLNQKIASL